MPGEKAQDWGIIPVASTEVVVATNEKADVVRLLSRVAQSRHADLLRPGRPAGGRSWRLAHSGTYLYAALGLLIAALLFAVFPRFVEHPEPATDIPADARAPSAAAPSSKGDEPPLAQDATPQAEASAGAAAAPRYTLFEQSDPAKPLPDRGMFSSSPSGGEATPLAGRPGGLFAAPHEGR